ncbi:MAG: hypothetical protein M3Z21_03140 [Pseudomonadota bacterium]|nr:hypothetical protein [Pseudomonadota bacterium]
MRFIDKIEVALAGLGLCLMAVAAITMTIGAVMCSEELARRCAGLAVVFFIGFAVLAWDFRNCLRHLRLSQREAAP